MALVTVVRQMLEHVAITSIIATRVTIIVVTITTVAITIAFMSYLYYWVTTIVVKDIDY